MIAVRFLQQYKLSSLYAGLGPNVVESALSSGVYFYFYSMLRERAVAWSRSRGGGDSSSKDMGVVASLLVATAAGACNQLITMPASVVATRMQGYRSLPGASDRRRPPTTWETIASVWREDGLGGFWKGLLPSMILLANPAVQYMLFEKIKVLMLLWKEQRIKRDRAAAVAAAAADAPAAAEPLSRRSADSDEAMETAAADKAAAATAAPKVTLSAGEVFLAGALAKIGATVVTYPLIVVKARVQAASAASAKAGGLRASTWGVVADTAVREGLGGFFKGLRAKILQTALNAALMLMLKEQLHGVTKRALTLTAAPASAPAVAAAAAVKAPAAAG